MDWVRLIERGYYVYNRTELAGMNTPFAQLWKEYALSDSRYLTNDVFTISIETVTTEASSFARTCHKSVRAEGVSRGTFENQGL